MNKKYWYLGKGRHTYTPLNSLKISPMQLEVSKFSSPPYVYLYRHHTYVPYSIEKWQPTTKRILLTLENLDATLPLSERKQPYDLFLSWSWLKEKIQKINLLEQLPFCLHFTVFNESQENLGEVSYLQPRKIQPLLIIEKEKQEIEIPVHPTFIRKIDWDLQNLYVSWPST